MKQITRDSLWSNSVVFITMYIILRELSDVMDVFLTLMVVIFFQVQCQYLLIVHLK